MKQAAMAHAAMLHPMPPAINPMIIDNGPELPLSPDMTHLEAALKLAEEALAAVQTASGSDQCMTAEDFIKHGHACILPGLEYYRNLLIRTSKLNGIYQRTPYSCRLFSCGTFLHLKYTGCIIQTNSKLSNLLQ